MTQCSDMQEALPFDYLPEVAAGVLPQKIQQLMGTVWLCDSRASQNLARSAAMARLPWPLSISSSRCANDGSSGVRRCNC